MRPNDDIDFTTLTWVKGELDETLKQAQQALEAYVEDPNDASQMRFCATYLHQVQGTLRMVELYGAAMVTEEMEQLASALLDSDVAERDEAYAVLMRGIVQLPDYLERLQSGHKDIPIVLLPLLNDLRAARGEKGLSEIVLFTPDLGRPLPASAQGPATPMPEQELRRAATTLRGHFQIALLKWFKNDNPDQNISTLAQVCDKLVSITAQEEARRLFWVAASVLDALRAKAFEPSPQLKQTIGKVEREIKRLADAGENSFRVDPPRELTRNLLYFVAHAPTEHGRIGELRETFNLASLLPSSEEIEHARGSMSGHNRALLDTVSAAIKDDLMRVKDALDLYLRTQNAQPAELSSQVDVLDRVSDTLGMLGLGVARRVVVEQRDAVHQVASGHRPANESSLLDIAGALLYVEATLDDQVQHLGAGGQQASGDAAQPMQLAETRRVLEAVVKEAQTNFANAKQAFVAFIESNWDHSQLETVPSLMGEVSGAMRIVELPRPAQYLDAVKVFTQVELLSRRRVPAGTQMETLADVLASLEYFLEALGEHRAGREKILDVAQRSLEALGYWPVPVQAVAPTEADRADVDARVAEAIAGQDVADDPYADQVPLLIAETPLPPPSLRAPPVVTEVAPPPVVERVPEPVPVAPAAEPPVADAGAQLAGFEGASDEIDDEIREVFVEEVQEEIANLEDLLPTWKQDPSNLDHLKSIRRVFHTLKGSGRLVGALTLGEFSWKIENMLNRVLDHTIQPTAAVTDLVDNAFNALPELLAALRGQGTAHVDLEAIKAIADRVAAGEQVRYEPRAFAPSAAPPVAAPPATEALPPVAPVDAADAAAADAAAVDEAPVPVVAPPADAAVAAAEADIGDEATADTQLPPSDASVDSAPDAAAPVAASIAVPSIDPVLFDILKAEVAGHLETVDAYLAAASAAPQPIGDTLLRAIHTMNGAFAMTDVPVITDVLGPLEGYLKRVLAHGVVPDAAGRAALHDTADAVRALMLELERPQPQLVDLAPLAERIAAARDALPEPGGPTAAPLMPTESAEPAAAADAFDADAAERGPGLTEAVSMASLQDDVPDLDALDLDAFESRLDELLADDDFAAAQSGALDIDADVTLTDTAITGDDIGLDTAFPPLSDLAIDEAVPAADIDAVAPQPLPAFDESLPDTADADEPTPGPTAVDPLALDDAEEPSADIVVTDADRLAWAEAARADAPATTAADDDLPFEFDAADQAEFEAELLALDDAAVRDADGTLEVIEVELDGAPIRAEDAAATPTTDDAELASALLEVDETADVAPEAATQDDADDASLRAFLDEVAVSDAAAAAVENAAADAGAELEAAPDANEKTQRDDDGVSEPTLAVPATDIDGVHDEPTAEPIEATASDEDIDAFWRDLGLQDEPAAEPATEATQEDEEEGASAVEPTAAEIADATVLDEFDWDALERETRPDGAPEPAAVADTALAAPSAEAEVPADDTEAPAVDDAVGPAAATPAEPADTDAIAAQTAHAGFAPGDDASDDLIFDDEPAPPPAPAAIELPPAPPRPDARDLAVAAAFLAGLDEADPDPDAPLDLADMDEELLDIFLEEGGDLLDHSDALMARLRDAPEDRESVVGLQRDLHTLKGGARMAGIAPVGDLSHSMESLLEAVAEGRRELPHHGVELLQRAFDRLHTMVTRVGERRALAMPTLLIQRVEALSHGHVPTLPQDAAQTAANEGAVAPAGEVAAPTFKRPAPVSAPIVDLLGDEDDISARLPQEQIRIRADLLDRLVNYAGEVAIYRARLEQQLGLFRGNLSELEQTTLRLREQLRKLEIETEAQIVARYQREAEIGGEQAFDPLELDRFSTLQQLSRALSESAADIVNLQGSLDDHTRQYETLLLQQSRVSSDLQEGLMRTRMVPFDSLVPRLRRIMRQTGTELGKKAQLKVDGAQGEMDRNVLERMTAPLEHMLRNAIAHGLETPEDRIAAGKPDEGTVRVHVLREGSEVVIRVSDDGRGLDRDAIRRKAISRSLLAEDVQVSDRDLYAFILEPGFSTAESVSKIAGRGVGMDVVYSEIRQLGGTLQIDSVRGRGTDFTIRLPFTLAVTQAVFVKQGETSFAVPIASVQGVARIDRDELEAKLAAGDAKFVYAGEDYVIHDMGLLLGDVPVKAEGSLQVPLLLARSGDQRAAICVDQVIGSREIVVKPVGPQVGSIPGIFGATIMGDGRVIVILDVAPLVRRHVATRKADEPRIAAPVVEARRTPLVMVVDDSITMRKVTSRVLERHSYEVLTAKDGVDAIEKLADRVPDVMLLDIEMPRMDGYELATHMRNDVRLRGVPIIMITSRTGEKHRQRAFEIGVDRYLGKPYQEAELMRNVQEILKVGRGEPA